MNRFEFLKNYKDFACRVRYITSNTLLSQLKVSTNPEEQKALMLRIVEDLVTSTEDLAMWLVTIHARNDGNRRYQNEWERLLMLEITQEQSRKILLSYKRIKTVKGFLKKLDFPTIYQLRVKLGQNEQVIIDAVEAIRFTIETAVKTREDGARIVERFHNKVKHGMMVYSDVGSNTSWVRDFSAKIIRSSGRISRHNRNFDIPIDIDKAERIVGTIKANAQGIGLIMEITKRRERYCPLWVRT